MAEFGRILKPAASADPSGATPEHTRPADWKENLEDEDAHLGEAPNVGVVPVARPDAPPAKPDFGRVVAGPREHPEHPQVTEAREQRLNDKGRVDIREDLYGPKQTGLESYGRGLIGRAPGVNLLMDEDKLEAARAWNPTETALGEVTGDGAVYAAPVGEFGSMGKWLLGKAVAKYGMEKGPVIAKAIRSAAQTGGIGAAQGASDAARHGDVGDVLKGAALGGTSAALMGALGGVGPGATRAGFGGFLRNTLVPFVANRAPMVAGAAQGITQASQPGATPYERAHGFLAGVGVPAAGTLATHAFQQGGARKIAPQRELAEAELAGGARKRAEVAAPKQLDADYEHNVRVQREQAENFDKQLAEGEGLAVDVNKDADARVGAERKAGEEALAAQQKQRADHEAKVKQGRDQQELQRSTYVKEAFAREAQEQAEAELAQILQAGPNGAPPGTKTPEATARGELGQIYGKAGTRTSHQIDAIERGVTSDDPRVRARYKHINDSLRELPTAELEKMDNEIMPLGNEAWLKKRTQEIYEERLAAAQAKAGAPSAPAEGGTSTEAEARPAGLARRVPVYPDLVEKIISKDLAAVPDPGQRLNVRGSASLPAPKPFAQHVEASGGRDVPNFRDLEAQRPLQGPVDNGYSRLDELVHALSVKDQGEAMAEAPHNVRKAMTEAGVPQHRDVAKQFEHENPRFAETPLTTAIDLLTFRARRLARDAEKGLNTPGNAVTKLTKLSTPAEAAYILREVENARGKVDARRGVARRVTAGAAAGTAVDNLFEGPAFHEWLKEREKEREDRLREVEEAP